MSEHRTLGRRARFPSTFLALPAGSPAGGSPAAGSPDGGASSPTVEYPTDAIEIMAPADPGGGWDSTARAMQAALQDGVVEQNVEVYNLGGAGGTIGLAQFVEQ